MVQAPSRRDRVRAATIEEIKGTARQLLVDEGPDAVSLRAIGLPHQITLSPASVSADRILPVRAAYASRHPSVRNRT